VRNATERAFRRQIIGHSAVSVAESMVTGLQAPLSQLLLRRDCQLDVRKRKFGVRRSVHTRKSLSHEAFIVVFRRS